MDELDERLWRCDEPPGEVAGAGFRGSREDFEETGERSGELEQTRDVERVAHSHQHLGFACGEDGRLGH